MSKQQLQNNGILTEVEKKLLLQLRSRFAPQELPERISADYLLIQWIREVKNNNLDKAEELLRKSLSWRRKNNVDSIFSWEAPSDLKKWALVSFIGYDIDNRPVVVASLGQHNFGKIIQQKQDDLYIKLSRQVLENTLLLFSGKFMRNGVPVHQNVSIIDLKGLSLFTVLNKRAIHMMTESFQEAANNYPNIACKYYFINGGKLFSTLFVLLKAVLPASLTDTMEAINSPAKWKSIFQETMPQEVVSKIVNANYS